MDTTVEKHMAVTKNAFLEKLRLKRTEIIDRWIELLEQKWDREVDQKISLVNENLEEKCELLSLLYSIKTC